MKKRAGRVCSPTRCGVTERRLSGWLGQENRLSTSLSLRNGARPGELCDSLRHFRGITANHKGNIMHHKQILSESLQSGSMLKLCVGGISREQMEGILRLYFRFRQPSLPCPKLLRCPVRG